MKVFGSSGTRGVANRDFTPAFVTEVAQAVGSVVQSDRMAIARDTRATGPMFVAAAESGLASVGVSVDRLGTQPTPAVQLYAEREGIPAIVVTASHNPPEYNGLKLIEIDGVEMTIDTLESIERALETGDINTVSWSDVGSFRNVESVRSRYIEDLLDSVDADAIAAGDLTVAVDPGHGAGCLTSPEFFRKLGCHVVTVNAQPDGRFPGRDPEPIEDNLDDLGTVIMAADADIGIAHDGDADRAIFFDETGKYIEGDAALAALAETALEAGDTAVSAVNVSQRLVDVVEAADATLELTPIGSTHIVTAIERLRAAGESVPIAGEGNGGIIFPEYRLARDGAYTAAKFLELIADQPASSLMERYDGYANVRRNLAYQDETERDRLLESVAEYADSVEASVETVDGFRLDFGDGWVLARPSGTEPLIRIYGEARTVDRAQEYVSSVYERLDTTRKE